MTNNTNTSFNRLASSVGTVYTKPAARLSLELFLSFGLVVLMLFVAIKPTLTTINELNQQIQEKTELSSKLQSKIAALTSALEVYAKSKDKISLLDEALPPTAKLIPTLQIIEKLATENNVIITAMSTNKVPEENASASTSLKASLSSLPISVTVAGQYQDMKKFVEALHQSRRTIQVLSANFSLEQARDLRLLTASLVLNAPYYDTQGASPSAEAQSSK